MVDDKKFFIFSLMVLLLISLSSVSAMDSDIGNGTIIDKDINIDTQVISESVSTDNQISTVDNTVNNHDDSYCISDCNQSSITDEYLNDNDNLNVVSSPDNAADLDGEIDIDADVSLVSVSDSISDKSNKNLLKFNQLNADSKTVYVSSSGLDTADGSESNPYKDIQTAINNMDADSYYTIILMDDIVELRESNAALNISRDNIKIKPKSSSQGIIFFDGNSDSHWTISASNVTFESLEFSSPTNKFFVINNSENIKFINCFFSNSHNERAELITVYNSTNVSVSKSIFVNLRGSNLINLTNSTFNIKDVSFTEIYSTKILYVNDSTLLVDGVEFYGFQDIANKTNDIIYSKDSKINIYNSSFSDRVVNNGHAIFIDEGTTAVIANNTFDNLTGNAANGAAIYLIIALQV